MNKQPRILRSHEQPQVPGAYWAEGMRTVVLLGPGEPVLWVPFKDGTPHSLHHHPNHDEFIVVVAGRIEQRIGGDEPQILSAGDRAFIPRGVPHSAMPLDPQTIVLVILKGEGDDYQAVT